MCGSANQLIWLSSLVGKSMTCTSVCVCVCVWILSCLITIEGGSNEHLLTIHCLNYMYFKFSQFHSCVLLLYALHYINKHRDSAHYVGNLNVWNGGGVLVIECVIPHLGA